MNKSKSQPEQLGDVLPRVFEEILKRAEQAEKARQSKSKEPKR